MLLGNWLLKPHPQQELRKLERFEDETWSENETVYIYGSQINRCKEAEFLPIKFQK